MTIDLDAIRRKVDALNGKKKQFSNVKLWKPVEGKHTVRILPWPVSQTQEGMPFIERHVYFGIARYPIVSPRSFGKPDPIDDFIRKLYDEAREGKVASKALADKLRPKLLTCAAVIDRAAEAEGVQLWSMNVMVVRDVFDLFLNKEVGNFMDLDKGRDITVTLSPSPKKFGGRTVFDTKVMPSFTTSPASSDSDTTKKWLENLPNVDEFYQPKSFEEIKTIFEEWLRGPGPSEIVKGNASAMGGNPAAPAPMMSTGAAELSVVENPAAAIEALASMKESKKPSKSSKKSEDIESSIDSMLKELDADSE